MKTNICLPHKAIYVVCFICSLFFSRNGKAQTFEYINSSNKSSEALTLVAGKDYYFVGGRFEPENWFYSVPYLIKLNIDGDTLFTRSMESSKEGQDQIVSLVSMKKNRIGILAETDNMLRISQQEADGKEVWSYSNKTIEHPVAMVVNTKNELIACGSCASDGYNNGENTVCVVKLDTKGKADWIIFAGEGERIKPYGITSTTSGEIILVVKHRVQKNYEHFLVRISAKGEILGTISLSKADLDEVFDIKTDNSGDMYLTGEGKTQAKPVLVKLNTTGQVVWQQMYEGEPGNYRAYSLAPDGDRGFVLAGRTREAKGFLIKTDTQGNQQWIKIFSGIDKAGFKKVVVTEDGYVLAGVTLSGNKNKAYCVKVDRSGDL